MRLLGLIGGMSWENTIDYYQILNQKIKDRMGGWNSAKLLLYSVNFEKILTKQNKGDWDSLEKQMISISLKLQEAGCNSIILCSNTIHKVADKVEVNLSIPLINVIDETANVIKQRKLKRIGLLGTRFIMEDDFYVKKLRDLYELDIILPEAEDRDYINNAIYNEFAKGLFLDTTKKKILQIIEKLPDLEGLILGCTEIPLLVKQKDTSIPLFDTLQIHLEAAIDFILN